MYFNKILCLHKALIQWNLGSWTSFIHSRKWRSDLFKNQISFICCLRDVWLITQVSAWKGCWEENRDLEFCYITEMFLLWITWSRTELFKNQDIQELRFDCTYFDRLIPRKFIFLMLLYFEYFLKWISWIN